ncbi:MAG TPA: NADH-quinone oxidoreductase subunit J [Microthrixaceae bacterium]|nr:NADH-quinone oxidoreductase subunit J [Microthrixaceae bacterium]
MTLASLSLHAGLLAQVEPTAKLAANPEITFSAPANVVFALTAVLMIYSGIRMVTTKNVVHAALWLMIVLGGVGINFLLLQAEFVAITQFLVYLGAILVLFLFGTMLTRAPMGVSDDLSNNQRWIGIGVGVGLLALLSYALIESFADRKLTFAAYQGSAGANTNGRTQAVADSIFSHYLLPFEMLSVLLLAALIGAIVLARKD